VRLRDARRSGEGDGGGGGGGISATRMPCLYRPVASPFNKIAGRSRCLLRLPPWHRAIATSRDTRPDKNKCSLQNGECQMSVVARVSPHSIENNLTSVAPWLPYRASAGRAKDPILGIRRQLIHQVVCSLLARGILEVAPHPTESLRRGSRWRHQISRRPPRSRMRHRGRNTCRPNTISCPMRKKP
jgi:hypothetical protein